MATTHVILPALKRFEGTCQTAFKGDLQQRDEDLWSEGLGCLIYRHSCKTSRRAPTLKVPIEALRRCNSPYLLQHCLYRPAAATTSMAAAGSELPLSIGDCGDPTCDHGRACVDLRAFVPPPKHASRNEVYAFNLTTRNYFAFLMSRPLVGTQLSTALVDLWRRVQLWSPDAALGLYDYCRAQGYTEFASNPCNAVAMLTLATEARWPDVWTDAFAHCAGMQSQLSPGCALDGLDGVSSQLVIDAAQILTLQIAHTTQALSTFLEEELSADKIGLSRHAREHLDRFRSNLHGHYVEKIGYYPPGPHETCDRRLWLSMYDDFRSLYDFLVDARSSSEQTSAQVLSGGVCIKQNLQAFDLRNDFLPLPHSLPLLPELLESKRAGELPKLTRRRSFRFSRGDPGMEQHSLARKALAEAANADASYVSNSLVQEYVRFEQLALVEKLPVTEARKVRWLLIYGMLQTLTSITQAPTAVQDTRSPLYPLCISSTSLPNWVTAQTARGPSPVVAPTDMCPPASVSPDVVPDSDHFSIHPDCEADNAEDFFAQSSRSRSTNDHETTGSSPLKRNSSLQSSFTSIHRSVIGSLSRRSSLRVLGGEHGVRRKTSFRVDLDATDEIAPANEEAEAVSRTSSPQYSPSQAASPTPSHTSANVSTMRPLVETLVDGVNSEDDDDVMTHEPILEGDQVYTRALVSPLPPDFDQVYTRDVVSPLPDDFDQPLKSPGFGMHITTIAGVRRGSNPVPTLVDVTSPPRAVITSTMTMSPHQREFPPRKENSRRLSGFDFGFVGCVPARRPPTSIPEEEDHQYYYDERDEDAENEDGDSSPTSDASLDAHEATLRALTGIDRAPICLNAGTYVPTGLTSLPSSPSSPVFYTHEPETTLTHAAKIIPAPVVAAVDVVERRKSRALPRLLNMARVRARFSMGP